jgi:hypothetical protein
MNFFTAIYQRMAWIGPPLMLLGLVCLGLSIRNVVRLSRRSVVLTLPLIHEQTFEVSTPGTLVLAEDGPLLSGRFNGLRYTVVTDYGKPVADRPVLIRATTSGFSTARREKRVLEMPHAGRFILKIEGLGPARERDNEHHIAFTKPHLVQTVGWILAIIGSAGLFIVSLVFFCIRLAGVDIQS